ncbi:hypothetical protein [Martelella alba]|uniref:Uncharacterized protein n=1 Tax=Martelella alba TaxID=2590451 RepID=A0ABY2SH24_9HYPH|nr:hypothetical protein [Martelella alba]TKI04501.1 hypothetical protein FCN80_17935 [Martelella alba]
MTIAQQLELKGEREGYLEGWVEGYQEGRYRSAITIAYNMVKLNMSMQTIRRVTGVLLEE